MHEIPSLAMTFSTPSSTEVRHWRSASSGVVFACAATVASASRGNTASAPNASRQATWCDSRASSVCTTIDVRVRCPACTRAVFTAPTASSAGTGARNDEASSSDTIWIPLPSVAARTAAAARRSTAARSPATPSDTGHVASRWKPPGGRNSRNVGYSNIDAASGRSHSTGSRGPSTVRIENTCRSRRWSIGGFVTWANRCLNELYSGRCHEENGAIAVSSPIE